MTGPTSALTSFLRVITVYFIAIRLCLPERLTLDRNMVSRLVNPTGEVDQPKNLLSLKKTEKLRLGPVKQPKSSHQRPATNLTTSTSPLTN